jgi:maleate isomerase
MTAAPGSERPPAIPALAPPGVILDGRPARGFEALAEGGSYPDGLSPTMKFGLLLPATNTTMEQELWRLVVGNSGPGRLQGVGLHTTVVPTPRPRLGNAAELAEYKAQFIGNLRNAVELALLANPQRLIMGMSLEHILHGLPAIERTMDEVKAMAPLPWTTWHESAAAALRSVGARRIGLLTPFDATGNQNATRLFEDLGYTVVAAVGFSCMQAAHIAHVPEWAKEKALFELLATPRNRIDAVVQCGTNMSLSQVAERLEPMLGIPILGINAVTFWHALREAGIGVPLHGGGRLLREAGSP